MPDVSSPPTAARLLARLDRLPRSAVAYATTGIAGLALFFAFYGNFAINVSFIQTCAAVVPGCTPETAQGWLTLPVVLYLVGYVFGAVVLAALSDRIGRPRGLRLALLCGVLGSLLTSVATSYELFTLGRALTGITLGGALPIANTYIGELAPARERARYTAISFAACAAGAMAGIWAGLVATTPPAPFPDGLPFALGADGGWRWMYAVAVLLGITALVASLRLPESPRWLLEHGRLAEATAVVATFELRARRRGPLPEPTAELTLPEHTTGRAAYRELLGEARYRRRVLLLTAMWFTGYATVFAYSTGSTVVLTSLGFTPPVAGTISAVGGIGFLVQGLFSARFSERLERRHWLPVGAALTVLGSVLVAALGDSLPWAFLGSFLVFFGFNVWVPPTLALSAESFPTRVRSAGFGLVDGLGVLGGMAGILVIAPLVPRLSPLAALLLISSFLVVSAVLAQFTPRTRNRVLEDVSP